MGRINVLDKNTAQKIAAGEVVTRPASVVKELVENAIDAGATFITVEIEGAGIRLIRVSDNGCGMDQDDLIASIRRHATSKIASEEDLFSISTLGFRGEALAAIASVSELSIVTKEKSAGEALLAEAKDGIIESVFPVGAPDGTSVVVRNLFYNTPARMKFLKQDSAEAAAVAAVVDQAALSHPGVSFRLIRDGKEIRFTPGDHKLENVIYEVYGREFFSALRAVEYEYKNIKVTGAVASPAFTRGSRSFQAFFVNGRPVRSKSFSSSLEEAFKNKLMTSRYPAAVLFFTVPAGEVDVNVHPEKIEVKFARERDVSGALYFAVKNALSDEGEALKTALDYQITEEKPLPEEKIPPVSPETRAQEILAALAGPAQKGAERPFVPVLRNAGMGFETSRIVEIPALYELKRSEGGAFTENREEAEKVTAQEEAPQETSSAGEFFLGESPDSKLRLAGEIFATYILAERGEIAYFIDKHALHERILYERLRAQGAKSFAQALLIPEAVTLTPEECAAALENQELFSEMGFLIEAFGQNTILVREAPMEFPAGEISALLAELIDQILQNRREIVSKMKDKMLYTIACKAAVKAGDKTSQEELFRLVEELFAYGDITHCPHGRPVAVTMEKSALEKRFGRIR